MNDDRKEGERFATPGQGSAAPASAQGADATLGNQAAPAAPSAPIPTLPKGGGAIRGIGEKFSANPVTGTGSLRIPIVASPGRAGMQPELALAYDSGAGNGPFGLGFHLSVPRITRKTDKGLPRYNPAETPDVFILSDAEDLVPSLVWNENTSVWSPDAFDESGEHVERYRPRIEGLFARIEKRTILADGTVYWRAVTKDNVTSVYGKSADARIADPLWAYRIFTWLLESTTDDRGNVISYEYKAEDLTGVWAGSAPETNRCNGNQPFANRYLKRIRYGNTTPNDASTAVFELVFDYGEHDPAAPTPTDAGSWSARSDPFSSFRSTFEIRTYRLCQRVLMFHHFAELGLDSGVPPKPIPYLVASTEFEYDPSPVLTKLISVTQSGYLRLGTAPLSYEKKSHPKLELDYSRATIQTAIKFADKATVLDLPAGVDGRTCQWVDLDGEGLPGVLCNYGGLLRYKKNMGKGELAASRAIHARPVMSSLGDAQVMDIDGDGRKELVEMRAPAWGYHERTDDDGWAGFHAFRAQPTIDLRNPDARLIDLSGDGFEDLLIADQWSFTWFPSLAKGGFGPPVRIKKWNDEEKSPTLVFSDASLTIFLADMTGDGLVDLVRIRDGVVCYWPNRGYGRFGAKVTMRGSPHFDYPDRFDPRRIRLADVDGSGTTDVIYLHPDGVRIYANESGNGLSAPIVLALRPNDRDVITFTDLMGAARRASSCRRRCLRTARRPCSTSTCSAAKSHTCSPRSETISASKRCSNIRRRRRSICPTRRPDARGQRSFRFRCRS
jgi:hypothetical protein